MKKTALITGILGQDGSYLAKYLIEKDYKVYGLFKNSNNPNFENNNYLNITKYIEYESGNIKDEWFVLKLVKNIKPDELYNLAAQSFVGNSWDLCKETFEVNLMGVLNLLEAIKYYSPNTKFYQASTSEMFGNSHINFYQDEETPFKPTSPYAISKLAAHNLVKNYRDSYNLFCCSGILFNHESPIRGKQFVTRKITDGVAKIRAGLANKIQLGNLDSKRDWGFAGDYVQAMWLMLQQKNPDDYVIATGETHSVKEFCEKAFSYAGIKDWEKHIEINPIYKRPSELHYLRGNPQKAKKMLGWNTNCSFDDLVKMMVDEDLKRYNVK
ncbi:MAG: GDP-mannose 4,6-dehydratase [Candidatus Aenigmatarchaeota archaeon]